MYYFFPTQRSNCWCERKLLVLVTILLPVFSSSLILRYRKQLLHLPNDRISDKFHSPHFLRLKNTPSFSFVFLHSQNVTTNGVTSFPRALRETSVKTKTTTGKTTHICKLIQPMQLSKACVSPNDKNYLSLEWCNTNSQIH